MSTNNNRLKFILEADSSSLERGLRDTETSARKTAKGISDAFIDADTGVLKLGDALSSVEFQAVAEEAAEVSKSVRKSFEKTGSDIKAVFASASADGLAEAIAGSKKALSDFGDEARKQRDAFVPAIEAAKEMGRQTELAMEAAKTEAQRLAAQLEKSFDDKPPKALAGSLDKLKQALAQTGKVGAKDIEAVEHALKDVVTEANKAKASMGALKALELGELATKIQGVADSISGVAGKFSDAGTEARNLQRQMSAAFSSPKQAADMVALIQKLQKEFGHLEVSTDDFALAAKRAATLGLPDLEKNMQRFTSIAITTGKGIDDVADDFGEFLASFDKGTFDPQVIETIRASFGIGAKALKEFGAEVDKSGKLLASTPEQAQKAQAAIIAYVDSIDRFQGVSQRSADSLSKLEAEVAELKRGVGEGSNALKEFMADAILPAVRGLNELSTETKATAGIMIEGAAGVGQFAAKGVELGAITALGINQLKELGITTASLTAASVGAAAGTAALIAAYGGLVLAVGVTVVEMKRAYNAIKDAEAAYESLRETQRRAAEGNDVSKYVDKNVAAIKSEVSAIEDAHKRRIEITRAMQAKDSEAQAALDAGDRAKALSFTKEYRELRKLRGEYDAQAAAVAAAEKKAQTATEQRFSASVAAFGAYKKAVSQGSFDSAQAQINELNKLIGSLKGDDLAEAQKMRKTILAEMFADEVDTLKAIAEQQQLSTSELKARLSSLVSQYQITGDARKKIEQDFHDFAKGLDEAAAARKKALAEEEMQLKRSALSLQKGATEATDAEIEALEAKVDKGVNVTKELERELKGRAENQKRILEAEAALDRISIKQKATADAAADPANAKQIQEQANERQRQLEQKLAQDKAKVDRQLAKDKEAANSKYEAARKKKSEEQLATKQKELDLNAQAADLNLRAHEQQQQAAEQAYKKRREALEDEQQRGRDNRAAMAKLDEDYAKARKDSIEAENKLALDAIEKRRTAERAGKSKTEQELIDKKAQLDVEKAIMDCKLQTEAIVSQSLALFKQETAELVKQRNLLIEQNKERDKAKKGFDTTIQAGAQSVEDAFGGNASGWGVSRSKREAQDGDGRTVADYDREIARREAEIARKEAAQKKAAPTFGTSPVASPSPNPAPPTSPFGSADTATTQAAPRPAPSGDWANSDSTKLALIHSAISSLLVVNRDIRDEMRSARREQGSKTDWQTLDFGRSWGSLPGIR